MYRGLPVFFDVLKTAPYWSNFNCSHVASLTSMGLNAPSYMNAMRARSRGFRQDRIIWSIFSSGIICDAVFVALSAAWWFDAVQFLNADGSVVFLIYEPMAELFEVIDP